MDMNSIQNSIQPKNYSMDSAEQHPEQKSTLKSSEPKKYLDTFTQTTFNDSNQTSQARKVVKHALPVDSTTDSHISGNSPEQNKQALMPENVSSQQSTSNTFDLSSFLLESDTQNKKQIAEIGSDENLNKIMTFDIVTPHKKNIFNLQYSDKFNLQYSDKKVSEITDYDLSCLNSELKKSNDNFEHVLCESWLVHEVDNNFCVVNHNLADILLAFLKSKSIYQKINEIKNNHKQLIDLTECHRLDNILLRWSASASSRYIAYMIDNNDSKRFSAIKLHCFNNLMKILDSDINENVKYMYLDRVMALNLSEIYVAHCEKKLLSKDHILYEKMLEGKNKQILKKCANGLSKLYSSVLYKDYKKSMLLSHIYYITGEVDVALKIMQTFHDYLKKTRYNNDDVNNIYCMHLTKLSSFMSMNDISSIPLIISKTKILLEENNTDISSEKCNDIENFLIRSKELHTTHNEIIEHVKNMIYNSFIKKQFYDEKSGEMKEYPVICKLLNSFVSVDSNESDAYIEDLFEIEKLTEKQIKENKIDISFLEKLKKIKIPEQFIKKNEKLFCKSLEYAREIESFDLKKLKIFKEKLGNDRKEILYYKDLSQKIEPEESMIIIQKIEFSFELLDYYMAKILKYKEKAAEELLNESLPVETSNPKKTTAKAKKANKQKKAPVLQEQELVENKPEELAQPHVNQVKYESIIQQYSPGKYKANEAIDKIKLLYSTSPRRTQIQMCYSITDLTLFQIKNMEDLFLTDIDVWQINQVKEYVASGDYIPHRIKDNFISVANNLMLKIYEIKKLHADANKYFSELHILAKKQTERIISVEIMGKLLRDAKSTNLISKKLTETVCDIKQLVINMNFQITYRKSIRQKDQPPRISVNNNSRWHKQLSFEYLEILSFEQFEPINIKFVK